MGTYCTKPGLRAHEIMARRTFVGPNANKILMKLAAMGTVMEVVVVVVVVKRFCSH